MNDEEQRYDQTDGYADFDIPDDSEEESKGHERQVNPCTHPAGGWLEQPHLNSTCCEELTSRNILCHGVPQQED